MFIIQLTGFPIGLTIRASGGIDGGGGSGRGGGDGDGRGDGVEGNGATDCFGRRVFVSRLSGSDGGGRGGGVIALTHRCSFSVTGSGKVKSLRPMPAELTYDACGFDLPVLSDRNSPTLDQSKATS